MERRELIELIYLIRKLQRWLDIDLVDVNYTAEEIIEIAEKEISKIEST